MKRVFCLLISQLFAVSMLFAEPIQTETRTVVFTPSGGEKMPVPFQSRGKEMQHFSVPEGTGKYRDVTAKFTLLEKDTICCFNRETGETKRVTQEKPSVHVISF